MKKSTGSPGRARSSLPWGSTRTGCSRTELDAGQLRGRLRLLGLAWTSIIGELGHSAYRYYPGRRRRGCSSRNLEDGRGRLVGWC